MKKLFGLLTCMILFVAVTCENEPLEGDFVTGNQLACETAILNSADAALAFAGVTDDNYTQLCTTYKSALIIQIETCGDNDGSLQAAVNSLGDCTIAQNPGIEGTWLLTAWIGTEGLDLNNDGVESLNFLDEMDCYTNETLVINTNGTAVATSNSYAEISYTIEVGTTDSFTYTIDCIAETEVSNSTWTQSGNIVTFTDGTGESTDWTLDGNELSILIPSGFVSFSEDGTSTTIQDLIFVYTKQ